MIAVLTSTKSEKFVQVNTGTAMSHEYASRSCWSSTASSTPNVNHIIAKHVSDNVYQQLTTENNHTTVRNPTEKQSQTVNNVSGLTCWQIMLKLCSQIGSVLAAKNDFLGLHTICAALMALRFYSPGPSAAPMLLGRRP